MSLCPINVTPEFGVTGPDIVSSLGTRTWPKIISFPGNRIEKPRGQIRFEMDIPASQPASQPASLAESPWPNFGLRLCFFFSAVEGSLEETMWNKRVTYSVRSNA